FVGAAVSHEQPVAQHLGGHHYERRGGSERKVTRQNLGPHAAVQLPKFPLLLIHQSLDGRRVNDPPPLLQHFVHQIVGDQALARTGGSADQGGHVLLDGDGGLDLELIQLVATEHVGGSRVPAGHGASSFRNQYSLSSP